MQIAGRNGRPKTIFEPAHLDGQCCNRSHTREVRGASGYFITVDMADNEVCARERTWREYVRIRDGVTVQ